MKIAVWEPVQAHREMMTVIWPTLKSMLMAGHKMTIEIKQSRRSTEQNAMFHSLIGKISTAMAAAGSTWTADDWKRLLVDQWAHDTDRKIGKVCPSLDGERIVQLGLQSHKFTTGESSEFIEFLLAWASDKGIDVS
jgi:hypothetical protein